ncbi:vWA domain-containing protein [Almyronema epifaneia]|uniref:VWA domain-containing protein n=1 Tax=Almyronema epifaneia S1 TaxID=2991925 RepID=A0ABW6IEY7_9CYAN
MTACSILKLSALLASILGGLWASPGLAAPKIEVTPGQPQGGRVTLSVKALDANNIPIDGLKVENFRVVTSKLSDQAGQDSLVQFNSIPAGSLRLIPPARQSGDEASYVIILVDMSGSMQELDTNNVRKLEGAIAAIRGFIKLARDSRLNLNIAVIPFGENSQRSECNYKVDPGEIEKQLLPIQDRVLDTLVDQLAAAQPCAATNLYDPLEAVVRYLGKPDRFEDESGQLARRSVILLSDGFDTASRKPNDATSEPRRFDTLQKVLTGSGVTVHTLGYGESLEKLRGRVDCSQLVREGDSLISDLLRFCKVANGDTVEPWIVDEPRLRQIAEVTGGISQFPENADDAAVSLATFFKTLQAYELQYVEPTADAADLYEVKVQVISEPRGIDVTSEPTRVRLPNFVFYQLPLYPDRLLFLFVSLAGIGTISFIFYKWSEKLKSEAARSLRS